MVFMDPGLRRDDRVFMSAPTLISDAVMSHFTGPLVSLTLRASTCCKQKMTDFQRIFLVVERQICPQSGHLIQNIRLMVLAWTLFMQIDAPHSFRWR
jgi:hypothetical protein